MEIKKVLEGTTLNIGLAGRLDTMTSPELDGVLKESLPGVEKLIFDFKELDYISSAGLRLLLASQKTMSKQGEMVVKNVSDEVMEVFDITGFVDILTIEK